VNLQQPVQVPVQAVEWACRAATTIKDASGKVLAECSGHGRHSVEDEAIAAEIVRRVNAHDDLLAASIAVAQFIGGAKDRLGRPDPAGDEATRKAREQVRALAERYTVQGGHHTYLDQCAALLRAVIARATGEPS
jgi:phosphosulfolactate phosphohydrolase-like enzyme